ILPAQPPFPSFRYFPFHADAGSHNANLISESPVGLIMPFTSQRAGTTTGAFGAPGAAATESGPSPTTLADVIVVWGNFRFARLSHDCWAKSAGTISSAISKLPPLDTRAYAVLLTVRPSF